MWYHFMETGWYIPCCNVQLLFLSVPCTLETGRSLWAPRLPDSGKGVHAHWLMQLQEL